MERSAPTPQDLSSCRIVRLTDLSDIAPLLPGIDAIFFDTAYTTDFADPAERSAFRERWLGRYLALFPQDAFLALAPDGSAAGYLVGCLDSAALGPAFADVGYGPQMHPAMAEAIVRWPAHLHINMRADARGLGVGGRLIERFAAHCRDRGVPGVHVVTGATSRAVAFYRKCGFAPPRGTPWPFAGAVLLGRDLPRGAPS